MDISTVVTAEMEYHQKLRALAQAAGNSLPAPAVSAATTRLMEQGALDDMQEGNVPWRPRYTLPDYRLLLDRGCRYLELTPPRDLDEALNTLLIFYHYVPSVTTYPVYLGSLDQLLEPWAGDVTDDVLQLRLELFLRAVDRMFPDNFVHYNLGPQQTKVGQALLAAEARLGQAVPNATLFCSGDTPVAFLHQAISTALATGKPYFARAGYISALYQGGCGVASCYNMLPIGGGAHTLVRLNLKELATHYPGDWEEFTREILPGAVAALAELMEKRIRFLVEESKFFAASFLVEEGFLCPDRFTAMAGIVGLAEAVAIVSRQEGRVLTLGRDVEAVALGRTILACLEEELAKYPLPYCQGSQGRALLHAQVGMPYDQNTTPGTRIAAGNIPPVLDQLNSELAFHEFFPTGTSSILVFDGTARHNPEAIAAIIRGAFAQGGTMLSLNAADSDVVRITGYLVRRKDLERGKGYHSVDESAAQVAENIGVARRSVNRF